MFSKSLVPCISTFLTSLNDLVPTEPEAFLLYFSFVFKAGPTASEIVFAVLPTSRVFFEKWNALFSVVVNPCWVSGTCY